MSTVTEIGRSTGSRVGQVTGTIAGTARALYPSATVAVPAELRERALARVHAAAKPVYAFAGATDFVVEQDKSFRTEVTADLARFRADVQETLAGIPVAALKHYDQFAARGQEIVTDVARTGEQAGARAEKAAETHAAPKVRAAKARAQEAVADAKDLAAEAKWAAANTAGDVRRTVDDAKAGAGVEDVAADARWTAANVAGDVRKVAADAAAKTVTAATDTDAEGTAAQTADKAAQN